MTYSPGHDFACALTRAFAASRVSAASTKRGLPSPRNLRMQKGRANQTPRTIYKGAVRSLSHEMRCVGNGKPIQPRDMGFVASFYLIGSISLDGLTCNARAILTT